jgi:hypothetical protein
MMNFQTFDQKLHDCNKIGYFNDAFDVDENQWDSEIGDEGMLLMLLKMGC